MAATGLQFRLLPPPDMFRLVWRDQPYAAHWLPGERAGRFPPSTRALWPRIRCCMLGPAAMGTIYSHLPAASPADAAAMEAVWNQARAHARDLLGLVPPPAPGVVQFARWVLDGAAREVPVSVWPRGYDWDLPFTVGGGIVWPSVLVPGPDRGHAQAAIRRLAKTFLHELVHVAQFQSLSGESLGGAKFNLDEFARWMQASVVEPHGFEPLPARSARICEWITDYYCLNFDRDARNLSPPEWWTQSMQNPDTLGIWYGVRIQDRLYLPWLVRAHGDGVGIRTWMLPLEWNDERKRHYVAAGGQIIKDQRRLVQHFGCGQFDHPHELAAHQIVDLLL